MHPLEREAKRASGCVQGQGKAAPCPAGTTRFKPRANRTGRSFVFDSKGFVAADRLFTATGDVNALPSCTKFVQSFSFD